MNWKEFFKFRWNKLVLFIIIGAIDFLLEALNTCIGPKGVLACLQNPFVLLTKVINGPQVIYLFTTVVFLALQIFYVYLLSCLVIHIYNRIKK